MQSVDIDPVTKAKVLLEALPYIQRFKGSSFVIKFGGSLIDDENEDLIKKILSDIIFLSAVGIRVIIVHGGGKAITRAMEAAKIKTQFINGMRVTDAASVAIVKSALNTEVNGKICHLIQNLGGIPMKLEGNKIFNCSKLLQKDSDGNDIDLGFVGNIKDVDESQITQFTTEGYIPVISSIGSDADGQGYNINADVAAAAVASSLHARRLLYLCDVPGLLKDPSDPNSLISTLPVDEVEKLQQSGVIGTGMLPKTNSAVSAIRNGVRRVHFINGFTEHSILLEIFTDAGIGTEIVQNAKPWRAKH